jgi:hypothetical protein
MRLAALDSLYHYFHELTRSKCRFWVRLASDSSAWREAVCRELSLPVGLGRMLYVAP